MDSTVMKLNSNQKKAVKWGTGPLLILAGPGSGKTQVLTHRIASIIEESPDKHFKILGLTYTNLAATEMRERIVSMVPNAGRRILLTTFHSFSADLLRQHGHHIGLRPDFTILAQDADRRSLLNEAINLVQDCKYVNGMTSEKLLPIISYLLENNVGTKEAAEVLQNGSQEIVETLASVYERYRTLMIQKNTLDFPGLIAEALGMLEKNLAVRKMIHIIYDYICVDEFQDTNLLQYKLLCHLVDPVNNNLFVVADDDQIIYQWNGASPKRIKQILDDFHMHLLQLPDNYRCPPEIIELANRLIKHNSDRFLNKTDLIARKERTEISVVRVKTFDDFIQEINWIAADISNNSGVDPAKCVILARTNKLLKQAAETLQKYGVSAYQGIRKNEFESLPLQWLHSVLRLANARSNPEYLHLVCKSFYSLESISLDVRDVVLYVSSEDEDFLRGFKRAALSCDELSLGMKILIKESLPHLSDHLNFRKFERDAFEYFEQYQEKKISASDIFDAYHEEKEVWNDLVREIDSQYSQVSLHTLLQELDMRSKTPPPTIDAVPCLTIHASKGMEFDHVYLIGMVEDQFPNYMASTNGDESTEMQEERRNCFVGITRAQKTLTLTYSSMIDRWEKAPSRFLYEMGLLNHKESSK